MGWWQSYGNNGSLDPNHICPKRKVYKSNVCSSVGYDDWLIDPTWFNGWSAWLGTPLQTYYKWVAWKCTITSMISRTIQEVIFIFQFEQCLWDQSPQEHKESPIDGRLIFSGARTGNTRCMRPLCGTGMSPVATFQGNQKMQHKKSHPWRVYRPLVKIKQYSTEVENSSKKLTCQKENSLPTIIFPGRAC